MPWIDGWRRCTRSCRLNDSPMMPSYIAERKQKPRRFGQQSPRACGSVGWSFIRKRRKSSIARMTTGEGHIRTRSSIFSATRFGRGDRRIVREGTSSTSARQSRIRRGKQSVRRLEAGIYIYAVTSESKICRGCSTRSFGGGSSITDAFTGRRSIRRCGNWIDHWPDGPNGNTRSCAGICAGQHIGSRVSRDVIRRCGRTGRWESGAVP